MCHQIEAFFEHNYHNFSPSPKLNRSTTAIKLMACKTSKNTIPFGRTCLLFYIGGWLFNELLSIIVKGVKQNYFFQRAF